MKKRETIILIIALLVASYGLIDFFILSKKTTRPVTEQLIANENQTTVDFATRSMAKIAKIQLQMEQIQWQKMKTKIESEWERDPFVLPLKPETGMDDSSLSDAASGIVYSGYMNVGTASFAVINGVEYKAGETINEYGYKVITITPKKVVLGKGTEQAVIFLKEE